MVRAMKRKMQTLTALLLCWAVQATAGEAYLQPIAPGWEVRPILTVGEAAANGYRMAGIPDGLGAFDNGDGTFTLLMNHEIAAGRGVARTHGSTGAFVSRWVVEMESLTVKTGEDLVQRTVPEGLAFSRLCSADLAPPSAFYNTASGKGYLGRLFLNGEEEKSGGRAFAHAMDGTSYELTDLGRIAWENVLAHPGTGEKTLVMGMDDFKDGLVLVYVGDKRDKGNPVERAGLIGGRLYTLKVENERFSLVEVREAGRLNGESLRARAFSSGATVFSRPEDGAWDIRNPNVFYFATTDKAGGDSRLYRLIFDDVQAADRGGRIETVLLARDIGAEMFDNLTVDGDGRVLIEEDPGDHARLAVIWLYDPRSGKTLKLAEADPARFRQGDADFMTQDEEHSGIIEVTDLLSSASWFDNRRRYYLGTTQVHLPHSDPDLVEHGQLWLISGPVAAR